MSGVDIVRGWKDQTFRDAALIGEHPAGAIDTTEFHVGVAAVTAEVGTHVCCSAWPCDLD